MAFILDEARTATAKASVKTKILELPPKVFSYYLQSNPEASRWMIDTLAERLRNSNEMRSKSNMIKNSYLKQ